MAYKKQPRSLETTAGLQTQHLNKVGVAQMDDKILEVIPGICGEIKPTGCIICTLSKNRRGYANKGLCINGEWKTLTFHRLVLENILGRPIRSEYFCCDTCDVRNYINSNHLWEGSRLENSQGRLKKGRIKDVASRVPKPQKQLRGVEIIPGIRAEIHPNGSMICTLAKRSDGYAIKGTKKVKGKTQSFYAYRLVLEQKLGLPVKPAGYFACHSCDDRGCVNPDHLWEANTADNSRDAIKKNRYPFAPGNISPTRKLKPEQVRSIRYLLNEGMSKAKIARTFAISRSQIILLARGQIYKDIL